MDDKNWYAAYTKPRWEKKLAERIELLGYEVYCPIVKRKSKWKDRTKQILEPLFKSYLFIKIKANEHHILIEVDGILNFIKHEKKYATIRDVEIEAIKEFLTKHEKVKIKKLAYQIGDNVQIENNAFGNVTGIITNVKPDRVELVIPILNAKLVVKIKDL